MLDTKIIRDHYSRMTDEQLSHLAQSEGQDLTPEALTVLHEEFSERKLDVSIFGTIDQNKTVQQNLNIAKAQESASKEFMNSIWAYAFDKKRS